MSKLDLTSLKKAIISLEKAVKDYQKTKDEYVRDATIQRFEYTYELATKMLRRYLESTEADKDIVDQLGFPNVIRLAAERGLVLHSWEVWKEYRDSRNTTSHAYDEDKAIAITKDVPDFLEEVKFLLKRLEQPL